MHGVPLPTNVNGIRTRPGATSRTRQHAALPAVQVAWHRRFAPRCSGRCPQQQRSRRPGTHTDGAPGPGGQRACTAHLFPDVSDAVLAVGPAQEGHQSLTSGNAASRAAGPGDMTRARVSSAPTPPYAAGPSIADTLAMAGQQRPGMCGPPAGRRYPAPQARVGRHPGVRHSLPRPGPRQPGRGLQPRRRRGGGAAKAVPGMGLLPRNAGSAAGHAGGTPAGPCRADRGCPGSDGLKLMARKCLPFRRTGWRKGGTWCTRLHRHRKQRQRGPTISGAHTPPMHPALGPGPNPVPHDRVAARKRVCWSGVGIPAFDAAMWGCKRMRPTAHLKTRHPLRTWRGHAPWCRARRPEAITPGPRQRCPRPGRRPTRWPRKPFSAPAKTPVTAAHPFPDPGDRPAVGPGTK